MCLMDIVIVHHYIAQKLQSPSFHFKTENTHLSTIPQSDVVPSYKRVGIP
jgi:hypothetical protein